MDITVRGWHRDMGTKTVASHDLSEFHINDDQKKTIRWSSPGLFGRYGEVTLAWGQTLKYTGDYRMQIDFTQSDILQLFKASYGRELDVDLLNKGFTISDELKKKILSEIKLADLTIGDLAKLGAGSSQPEPETRSVRPLPSWRRF
ncbi:MAG: hypothetical protein ACLQDM_09835 [Bradyrhizobium sp.]